MSTTAKKLRTLLLAAPTPRQHDLGLLTRLAALGLGLTMLGAISVVHLVGGFFLPAGVEYALALLAANVSIILMGPGPFAIDSRLVRRAEAATPAMARAATRRAA